MLLISFLVDNLVHQIITATKLQDKELMYSMKKFYPAVVVMHPDYDRGTI